MLILQIIVGAEILLILALGWYVWDCEARIKWLGVQFNKDTERLVLDEAKIQSMLNEIQRLRIAAGEIQPDSIDIELIMALHDGTLPLDPLDTWEDEGGAPIVTHTPFIPFVLLCDGCHPQGYSSGQHGECVLCGVDVGLEIDNPNTILEPKPQVGALNPGSRHPHDCEDDGYSDDCPQLPF